MSRQVASPAQIAPVLAGYDPNLVPALDPAYLFTFPPAPTTLQLVAPQLSAVPAAGNIEFTGGPAVGGEEIAITLGSQTFTYTAVAADTVAIVSAALAALINAANPSTGYVAVYNSTLARIELVYTLPSAYPFFAAFSAVADAPFVVGTVNAPTSTSPATGIVAQQNFSFTYVRGASTFVYNFLAGNSYGVDDSLASALIACNAPVR